MNTTYEADPADPGRCRHCGKPAPPPQPLARLRWRRRASSSPMTAYSEDALVLVQFPLPGQDSGPETWPWLPGIITAACGPDEWRVVVLDERLEQNGSYPSCYRDASELRPRAAR